MSGYDVQDLNCTVSLKLTNFSYFAPLLTFKMQNFFIIDIFDIIILLLFITHILIQNVADKKLCSHYLIERSIISIFNVLIIQHVLKMQPFTTGFFSCFINCLVQTPSSRYRKSQIWIIRSLSSYLKDVLNMSHMISLLTCYVITLLNSPEICHLNLIVTTLLFKL